MIVCVCNNTNDKALLTAIKEAPVRPFDQLTKEEQIFNHVRDTLKISTGCENCESYVKEFIGDIVNFWND